MRTLFLFALGATLELLYLLLSDQDQALDAQTLEVIRISGLLVLALAIARSIEYLIVDLYFGRARHQAASELFRMIVEIIVYSMVGLAVARFVFDMDVTELLATSAVVSVVLGFALQPTLGNLFSGVALELERPMRLGDFVRQEDVEGTVVAMNWRSITIENLDKRRVVLPNAEFTNKPVEIHPFDVPTSYPAKFSVPGWVPPSKVLRISQRVLAQPIHNMVHDPAPTTIILEIEPYSGSIIYEASFFTYNAMEWEDTVSDVLERLWYALQREGIPMTQSPGGAAGPEADDPKLGRALLAAQGKADTAQAHGHAKQAQLCRPWLAEVSMLAGLSDARLDDLAQASRHLFYTRHEQVAFDGGGALYIIASGRLRVPRSTLQSAMQVADQTTEERHGDWPRQLLDRLRKELTYHIGPVAKVLVADTAKATRDPHALFHSLGALIPDEHARAAFLASAPTEPSEELLPGAAFGEWAVAAGDSMPAWEGYAVEQTELVVVSAEALGSVLRAEPDAIERMAQVLAESRIDTSPESIAQQIRRHHRIA